MAKYVKQEIPKRFGIGKSKCYYRIQSSGNVSSKDMIDEIATPGSGLSKGSVAHVFYTLCEKISYNLSKGRSVTIDGLGTFMAAIAVDKEKPIDSIDGDGTKRNAASLHVDGVNFRASRDLVSKVASMCTLKRGGVSRVRCSPYTKNERIARAIEYLKDLHHPVMRVADYASLNGLSQTTATRELRQVSQEPGSGITFIGSGRGKVYLIGETK